MASPALAGLANEDGVAAILVVLGGWVDTESVQLICSLCYYNPTLLDPRSGRGKSRAQKIIAPI